MLELTGTINDKGEAHIFNRKKLTEWFEENKGKMFTLKIERKKKKRSNEQNAYYWGVVIPMVRERLHELGNEFNSQETHEALKAKFNTKDIVNEDGVVEDIVQSTGALSTTDFMIYLDKIQRWANQFLGIVIPNPNEALQIDFDNKE
jgi:hypothetical protein